MKNRVHHKFQILYLHNTFDRLQTLEWAFHSPDRSLEDHFSKTMVIRACLLIHRYGDINKQALELEQEAHFMEEQVQEKLTL